MPWKMPLFPKWALFYSLWLHIYLSMSTYLLTLGFIYFLYSIFFSNYSFQITNGSNLMQQVYLQAGSCSFWIHFLLILQFSFLILDNMSQTCLVYFVLSTSESFFSVDSSYFYCWKVFKEPNQAARSVYCYGGASCYWP